MPPWWGPARIGLLPTADGGANLGLGPWKDGIGIWAPILFLVFVVPLLAFIAMFTIKERTRK